MSEPSFAEIEQALFPFREGRRAVMGTLLESIYATNICAEPFVALSRFFCRLKSADSIVEKLRRKGIAIQSASEIPDRMLDILGFRLIVADECELWAIDEFMGKHFEIVSKRDHVTAPGEFGDRGIEYAAQHHVDGKAYPFELQLRTFLQHYWASRSFHLFHKKPREAAVRHQERLLEFADALQSAEATSRELSARPLARADAQELEARPDVIFRRVHLVAVEPGETFATHVIVPLTGEDRADHDSIVERKLRLYSRHPGAAVVECACVGFLSFHLNEPLVQVPLSRLDEVHL